MVLAGCNPGTSGASQLFMEKINLPPGFKISVYAADVPGARSLALSPDGTLFVGSRGTGNVYAIPDRNKDHKGDAVIVIARELNSPNGVAFREGSLYVAEISRVLRYDGIENDLSHPPRPTVINDSFPTEEHHGWKYIRFGPDGWLYIPVGAPCNVCERLDDERFATIMRMKPDGSGAEIFARGVRNSVGYDWQPGSGDLWFTDNGRDWLGDDKPPDELNRAPRKGMHFGFPYCHGKGLSDPEFGRKHNCKEFTPCAMELNPHVAALGMRFYTGTMFPGDYQGDVLIAEHGSWNRSTPIGYRVARVRFKDGKPYRCEVFADGWMQPNGAWGRPVDLLILPDGSLLVSDDLSGTIYRISYEGKAR